MLKDGTAMLIYDFLILECVSGKFHNEGVWWGSAPEGEAWPQNICTGLPPKNS